METCFNIPNQTPDWPVSEKLIFIVNKYLDLMSRYFLSKCSDPKEFKVPFGWFVNVSDTVKGEIFSFKQSNLVTVIINPVVTNDDFIIINIIPHKLANKNRNYKMCFRIYSDWVIKDDWKQKICHNTSKMLYELGITSDFLGEVLWYVLENTKNIEQYKPIKVNFHLVKQQIKRQIVREYLTEIIIPDILPIITSYVN